MARPQRHRHSGDTVGGYSSFVFRFPEQAITIAGAVNTLDPAAGYAVLMPRAGLLAPGYTMPGRPQPSRPTWRPCCRVLG